MIEKLPVPFGLVRWGVAPDHPEVRNVTNDFEKVVSDNQERFRFFGNVEVGSDISLATLRQNYDAVVLGHGCSKESKFPIEHTSLSGVISANEFVNWYNVYPTASAAVPRKPLLDSSIRNVVVIGQGNVALDIARLVTADKDSLNATDIGYEFTQRAVETPRHVSIIGRRGPMEASFTNKELREMTSLVNAICDVNPEELKEALKPVNGYDTNKTLKANRAVKRAFELYQKLAANHDGKVETLHESNRVSIKFFLKPIRAIASESDPSRIGSLLLEETRLEAVLDANNELVETKAVGTGAFKTVKCDLLIFSVGFYPTEIEGVKIDRALKMILNEGGQVASSSLDKLESDGVYSKHVANNVFTTGWVKRGGKGNIATSVPDATETAGSIKRYLESVPSNETSVEFNADLIESAATKNGKKIVTWDDWHMIESAEKNECSSNSEWLNKSRVRTPYISDMLKFCKKD